jgi:hypothetical protein
MMQSPKRNIGDIKHTTNHTYNSRRVPKKEKKKRRKKSTRIRTRTRTLTRTRTRRTRRTRTKTRTSRRPVPHCFEDVLSNARWRVHVIIRDHA